MSEQCLGYCNHDTAKAALAMSNEKSLYDLIAKQKTRPKYLGVLWESLMLFADTHGFNQRQINRREILEHAQSIWDDNNEEA